MLWFAQRETFMAKQSADNMGVLTHWRQNIQERCPAIYAKYGPFAVWNDVTPAEMKEIQAAGEQGLLEITEANSPFTKRCSKCSTICRPRVNLKYCSNCYQKTVYCSRDCVKHWRLHKPECARIRSVVNRNEEMALSMPKLALVDQTLRTWCNHARFELLIATFAISKILTDSPLPDDQIVVFSVNYHGVDGSLGG
ncbi:hypothetical protein RQP46_005960 [Phenoliferia psychrophenolica]